MKKILIVEDDPKLRSLLQRFLEEQDYKVFTLPDGRDLLRQLAREPVHLIVLDWMMPGEDGLSLLKQLRAERNNTPVIMLTAKGDEEERIEGLEHGADDFLPKPFNPRELLARIASVLRRHAEGHVAAAPEEGGEIRFGDFVLNLATRQLLKSGELMPLTSGEYSVLKVLATHAGQNISRDQLMHLARGRDHDAFDRAIDVQISRLRKLIEANPAKPAYIQTVWGHGYVFVPNAQAA
ncbi:MAG: hypothetical protein RLZZ502_1924 [Pseudomonadota bacterium]|jgi:two-component system phosphate regulon response regulator OmpR